MYGFSINLNERFKEVITRVNLELQRKQREGIGGGRGKATRFTGSIDNHILRQGAEFGLVVGAHAQPGTAYAQHGQGPIDKGH